MRRSTRPTTAGTSAPSSTRCSSAASTTPTATAPATCAGLTEKLDYLEWLGVDCIWLLPFYQSPLRDGGYDISDFFTVLPEYGDLGDAVELVEEAHRRGIRVIADMVMNHTSDQHPWFQESPPGPHQPQGRLVRVERRRPALVRGPHHLRRHRDVELDVGPAARAVLLAPLLPPPARPQLRQPRGRSEAMLDVVRFWLDLGLDGFRLDAVPYLFERDGTNGENLPETHEYLQAAAQGGRRRVPRPGAAGRGQPVAGRRRRLLRRRRRVPHVLPLPAHAAHVHGRAPRAALPDHRDPGPDARRSPTAASGASSCATTTSSRSRWSPTRSATTCTPSTPRTRG